MSYWCSSGGGKSIMEIPRIDREGERNYFFEERFSFLLGGRCGNGALHSSSSSRKLLIVEIAVLICSRTEMINSGWPHKLFRISMSNVGCLCGEFEKSTQKARKCERESEKMRERYRTWRWRRGSSGTGLHHVYESYVCT